MNLEPNDLVLFARVVDEGSFSRAAERLGFPKSTVSRRVAALEAQLGEQLLRRTTRKLTVTDFGRAVLEHAHHVVEDVAAAQSLAQHRQVQPSGRLRVTMPNDMGNLVLAPMLAEFVLKYPAVTLEVDLSSRFVDLIAENFDVAVRMGELRDDATLAARRIATLRQRTWRGAAFRRSPKRSSSTTRCGSWCAPAIRRYGRSSGVRPAGKAFRRVTRRPIHRSC
jgi:DNA-binding transcriptional LysR family regulator